MEATAGTPLKTLLREHNARVLATLREGALRMRKAARRSTATLGHAINGTIHRCRC